MFRLQTPVRQLCVLLAIVLTTLMVTAVSTAAPISPSGDQSTNPSQPVTELPPYFEQRTEPVALLASYYNAINLKDYARAYAYWENVPRGATLEQFTQGFATTARVAAFVRLPVFVGAAAGNFYASIPTLLVAEQTDGTRQTYGACFITHKTNVPVGNATEPDPNWFLYQADVVRESAFDLNRLATICENTAPEGVVFDSTTTPLDALATYFEALNVENYPRAYAIWFNPPRTYADFAAGYNGTASIEVTIRLDLFSEGTAGTLYFNVPVLLTATRNGTPQAFTGCYFLRKATVPVGNATEPDPNWYLSQAAVRQLPDPDALPVGLDLLAGICSG